MAPCAPWGLESCVPVAQVPQQRLQCARLEVVVPQDDVCTSALVGPRDYGARAGAFADKVVTHAELAPSRACVARRLKPSPIMPLNAMTNY